MPAPWSRPPQPARGRSSRDGVDGLLAAPAAPPALATALARLLDDPRLRARLARAGRETARARFDLPVVARQISAVLCQVAAVREHPCAAAPADQL